MTAFPLTRLLGLLLATLLAPNLAGAAQSFSVQFEDQTRNAFGVIPRGPSFGAGAWGDFDRDGFPDLWLGNHAGLPSLWRNNGDGSFTDVAAKLLPSLQAADSHGAAWADFDRDGDLDLIECVGAELGTGIGPNHLWKNNFPLPFTEVAGVSRLAFQQGRARMPLWLDWNEDGLLDVIIAAFPGSASKDVLFTQLPNQRFFAELGTVGFMASGGNTRLAQLADFDSDGRLEVLMQARRFPDSVMDFDRTGFRSLRLPPPLEPISNVQDVAIGDFDGDQDLDFYLTRDPFWSLSQVAIDANGALRAAVRLTQGQVRFTFHCAGDFIAELPVGFPASRVYLGGERIPATELPLEVHADDKQLLGTNPGLPGSDYAIYIGRETDSDTYEVVVTAPMDISGSLVIRSRAAISVEDGQVDRLREAPDVVIWADQVASQTAVPDLDFVGRSCVTADFDNDGDLDIYVMRTGAAVNRVNRLYENVGDGEFRTVPQAAGAKGPLLGVADSVSVVDYDQDGFLDLFLTNGWGLRPLTDDAPVALLRNRGGNGNHWLKVELRGTRSNTDGIGSVVRLKANGVWQRRDQGGGMHRSTQNHAILHFGLGRTKQVKELAVTWPDGSVQVLRDLKADQTVLVVQN
jgi:hypothetical protein